MIENNNINENYKYYDFILTSNKYTRIKRK